MKYKKRVKGQTSVSDIRSVVGWSSLRTFSIRVMVVMMAMMVKMVMIVMMVMMVMIVMMMELPEDFFNQGDDGSIEWN